MKRTDASGRATGKASARGGAALGAASAEGEFSGSSLRAIPCLAERMDSRAEFCCSAMR